MTPGSKTWNMIAGSKTQNMLVAPNTRHMFVTSNIWNMVAPLVAMLVLNTRSGCLSHRTCSGPPN